jgi:hypothetical protein
VCETRCFDSHFWCSQTSSVGANFGVKHDGFFAEQALQPTHEPSRHIGTLPRSNGVAVAERVFPVLWRAWYRNAGVTPLSPVAAGNQVPALSPAALSAKAPICRTHGRTQKSDRILNAKGPLNCQPTKFSCADEVIECDKIVQCMSPWSEADPTAGHLHVR